MRFAFTKCHGSGNDFPLIDARHIALADAEWARVARALADRAGQVGGDGLLLLTGPDARHAFGMRMFNSDGSEAETCLNGLRCVARAGFAALELDHAQVRLKTSSAVVSRDRDLAPGVFTVREVAGPAGLDMAAWPMGQHQGEWIERPVPGLPTERAFTGVAMPNPHLVTFVEQVEEEELVRVGQACEAAPAWLPNRANVSFVEVRGGDLFVRTFERGVGLTNSCGSAMAASTFAAALTGRTPFARELTVFNAGGRVLAEAAESGMVRLSGNATVEWTGAIAVDPATGEAGPLEVTARYPEEVAAWARTVAPAAPAHA